MLNLVFLGPPGAGKGTQAVRVSAQLGLPHISTGDMLRSAIREGTEIGLKAKQFMDAGNLVPDEVVIGIVRERLAKPDCAAGYILDGFPRTIPQAEALDMVTEITAAVNIAVADEALVTRLSGRRSCTKCGHTTHVSMYAGENCPVCGEVLVQRDDDKPDTIRNRLAVYNKNTQPLIDYYQAQGKLTAVDGSQPVDEVFGAIIGALTGQAS